MRERSVTSIYGFINIGPQRVRNGVSPSDPAGEFRYWSHKGVRNTERVRVAWSDIQAGDATLILILKELMEGISSDENLI